MLLSGFAGLGSQIVWTQQAGLWLGHEAAAAFAVVSAFFGGLGLGAWALGARIERSTRPQRWYAACEAVIALWSIVLALGLRPLGDALLVLVGAQPHPLWQGAVTFLGLLVVLLPATMAMGATLPAMERLLSTLQPDTGGAGRIATLYAANTAGAVGGALVTAFWLVPAAGLTLSALSCAGLNLLCAALALRWRVATAPPPATQQAVRGAAPPLLRLCWTGLLGIAYEVLVIRVASQVTEDTVYTFALLLAVYLVGTALGAAVYRRLAPAARDPASTRNACLTAQSFACLLGTASLWFAPEWRDAIVSRSGSGFGAALAGEAAIALAAFALPTFVMGALFSHLAVEARQAGHRLGLALAANTLGATVAPLLFGAALAPAWGPKAALLAVAAGYLVAAGAAAVRSAGAWVAAAGVAALALLAPPLAFVDIPPGGRVLSYQEGLLAAVSVVEDADGVARLRINNRQQEGSSATRLADARQAWLPLLWHPAPQHVLFIGLGTGVTARAAADDASLHVDAVELLPEVIASSVAFARDTADPPTLHVMAADARRYVRAAAQHYDVIVSDNFHPARSGSGALYTVEHFAAVRARLATQGVFCQWLPLHQLDLATLSSIVRSFLAVFPSGSAMLATNSLETPVIGLIARADDHPFDATALRARQRAAAARMAEFGLDDEFALFGSLVADAAALQRSAAGAPLNTDDRPVVAYSAPRLVYATDSLPRERLLAWLTTLSITRGAVVDDGGDTAWTERLEHYRRARDQFLAAGRAVRPTADARAMLTQVREPLLAVLRESPDFRPAYEPLRRLADALATREPELARSLRAELERVSPAAR